MNYLEDYIEGADLAHRIYPSEQTCREATTLTQLVGFPKTITPQRVRTYIESIDPEHPSYKLFEVFYQTQALPFIEKRGETKHPQEDTPNFKLLEGIVTLPFTLPITIGKKTEEYNLSKNMASHMTIITALGELTATVYLSEMLEEPKIIPFAFLWFSSSMVYKVIKFGITLTPAVESLNKRKQELERRLKNLNSPFNGIEDVVTVCEATYQHFEDHPLT